MMNLVTSLLAVGRPAAGDGARLRVEDVEALAEAIDTDGLDGWDWGTAGIVLVGSVVAAIALRWLLIRLLCRRFDRAIAVLLARFAGYIVFTVGFTYALGALGVRVGPLLGALGIAGIALAVALKDILENFVAGIMLQLRRPFTYGDEVLVGEMEGRVDDIDGRLVTIITPDGETVLIPSATVIKSEVTNYTTRGSRRTDLPVGVAYGSDLERSRDVLLAAVEQTDGVLSSPAPTVLLTGFGDSSIDFVVRYWHEPSIASFWQVRSDVAFAVERGLAGADITIPFPQRTLWWAGDTDD